MASAEAVRNYWSLNRGIITEATELAFPPDATTDEENFDISSNGKRVRRLGLDFVSGLEEISHSGFAETEAVSSFRWDSPANLGNKAFIVRQQGASLYIYCDSTSESNPTKEDFVVSLLTYKVAALADSVVKAAEVDMAVGKGKLFVVSAAIEPLVIEYDPDTDTIAITVVNIQERDFVGEDDSLSVTTRPAVLSDEHEYNLYNQGWTDTHINAYQTAQAVYPSNADIWYLGKLKNSLGGTPSADTFDADQLDAQDFGFTRAPRGKIVRNVFNTSLALIGLDDTILISSFTYDDTAKTVTIETSASHGLSVNDPVLIENNRYTYNDDEGLVVPGTLNGTHNVDVVDDATHITIDHSITGFDTWATQYVDHGTVVVSGTTVPNPISYDVRPTAVGFFAGRVWFGGIEHPELAGNIYFSQILTDDTRFGKCYQEADPTAEHISDIIATDGGRVTIPGMGKVLTMLTVGNSFLIFTSQGVWQISGADERSAFSATGYSVRQLSGMQVTSRRAIVIVAGFPLFWTTEGIYVIVQDTNTGFLTTESLTDRTIQTLYNNIPDAVLLTVKGCYDDRSKRVIWLYKSSSARYGYDLALILDVRRNAFFKYRFDDTLTLPMIQDLVVTRFGYDGNKVFYFASYDSDLYLATCWRDDFMDWFTHDGTGVDPGGFLLTAYEMLDPTSREGESDAIRLKHSSYVAVYLDKTETGFEEVGGALEALNPSSCLMQARWNWADSTTSGKFSSTQQVYRFRRNYIPTGVGDTFDDGQPVVVTRNRVRGTGRALQVKFRTETGKDCRLIGWSVIMHMNRRT